jgi:siderophore synthetase component
MRTVAFDDSHYKLALDVHTTSARRVVSAMSVTNGPRVSALLDRIAATDPSTARGIRVAGEHDTGGLDSSLVGELAHHVGVIVRNADDFCCPEGTVVCCAALGSTRPGASAPILAELVAGYRQPEPQERAAAMLADYTGLLLPPLLRLLSHWGIALEPHLQNTLVEIVDGRPAGFIVRDLGGIRIHGGRLRAAGESLEVHPDSFIVTDDLAELRGKLAHCALHAHLGTLVGWLEDHLGLPAKRAWSTVAEVIRDAYGGIRHDDLEALAAPRVRAKALFTMRIQDRSSEYHYFETDNPLAQALASNPT